MIKRYYLTMRFDYLHNYPASHIYVKKDIAHVIMMLMGKRCDNI